MAKVETRKFDAEVGKVLNLMIHSLYTNKDIFLRELISNASDACDKLKFESTKQDDLLGAKELKITISADKEKRNLTIRDNGIGMNKQDLVENLGTIARSGTQKFLEQLSGNNKQDVELIGQFGVGFYSAFMVADNIIVHSKKAGDSQAWTWSSNGAGEFSVSKHDDKDFTTGTEIIINLKDGEDDYLDQFKIQHIVNTYSEHISVPIEFSEEGKDNSQLNSSSALWTKNKSEITEDEYNDFYKKISSLPDKPWMTIHNKNEGVVEYTNLLFIPSTKTYDLFHPDRKRSVKLYIKKVFINDEGVDVIPHYLRFLRGVIDSQDLPLNISRETLQHNKVLEKIKDSTTKKVLSELAKKLEKDRDSYLSFWENFGPAIKEGLCEFSNNHESLLDICLFKSLKQGKYITLKEYIDSMEKEQSEIYYISGSDEENIKDHPQLEGFMNKGLDVLLFTDAVDNFWVNVVSQYKEKSIKSVTRADIDLNKEDAKSEDKEEKNEDHTSLVDYFKEVLQDTVKDIKLSKKLTDSPVCLAVAEGGMDIRMERLLAEQKQLKMPSTKILEINPSHQIILEIEKQVSSKSTNAQTEDLVRLLFDQACILEGEPVQNPVNFSKRMNTFLTKNKVDA